MFCRKCGAELLEEGRFCSKCGAQVEAPATEKTDAELERLAALDDREAFGVLYERHSGRVYDFLLRMVGDPDEASDLTQETFLRAMRALSTEEKGAAFLTWALTIARNLALKRLERRKRTVALAEREGDDEAPIFDQVDPDRLARPEAAAEAREMSGLVWEAAVALDPKQYSLLDLHVRQGLDSAEIAQVLGVSKGNAYTMISRLKDTFESAVASLFMLRVGRRDCPELNRLLEEQSITALSPTVRKLVESHVADCEGCRERRRKLVSPASILGAFAAVPLPLVIKQRVAEALVASWAQAGTQAATAGIKGLLSQPVAKLTTLSTTWKAAIIGSVLIVATGGGVGTWVAVTGGLPGSGGGESPGSSIPAVATASPAPTAVPVAPTGQPPPANTGRIVFRSNRDSVEPSMGSTYLMDADGSNVRRLGAANADTYFVDSFWLNYLWSPDGSKVAFHKCPEQGHEGTNWGALYVMNSNGSDLTTIATGTVQCFTEDAPGGMSWSPDSKRIVFFQEREPYGLYIADADGSNLTYLAEGIYPQWLPRGDTIVFIDPAESGWQCNMYLMSPDGTNRRLIARLPCESEDAGGRILLIGPRAQWSPDGLMLAFSASQEEPPMWAPAPDTGLSSMPEREIFVMAADGSGLTNITNSPSDDYSPVWVDCSVPTAGCEATVTNVQPEHLNVRERPKTEWDDSPVIRELSEGDTVCLIGAPDVGGGYKWWPVSAADGTEGWAAAFDPKDPARPWITPTGNPCGAEPEESAAPNPSDEGILCENPMPLGTSISDPAGDVPFALADIVSVRVEATGQEALAQIQLKDLPEELTFNRAEPNEEEYGWEIYFNIDGDRNTGCNATGGKKIGAEYALAILYFVPPESPQVWTGALLDSAQTNVWKCNPEDGHWTTETSAAATADEIGNRLTIQGSVPALGPSTRWCAATYCQDRDERVTQDVAPE
jgi:RNA polymerase sigma factor (sigma-70 family)